MKTLLFRCRYSIWVFMIAAFVSIFCGCGKQSEPKAPATPTTSPADDGLTTRTAPSEGRWAEVRKGSIREFVPAVGSFRARQMTQIGAQVSGRVEKVLVDVGDLVKKDQELVRLDPAFFEIEVAQSKAVLEGAKVAKNNAELNYNRMKNLWEKPNASEPPSISRKIYDDAKLAFESAVAKVKEAEQALHYAEQRYRESIVRAPYDAVVTKRMVDPGESITSTPVTALLEIQEIAVLELDFSLPQSMLSNIKVGDDFTFEVEGITDGIGRGKIAVIFPAVDEATRSFKCRAYIDNHDLKYKPGLLAQVRVVDRVLNDVLVIPRKALEQTATGWQVLVSNDGHIQIRSVQVGLVTDELVQITGGLRAGNKVFIRFCEGAK